MGDSTLRVLFCALLVLGLMGVVIVDMILRHRRGRETLDLLRHYASVGKDPPPELFKGLDVSNSWFGGSGEWWWQSPQQAWNGAVIFGAMAAGFAAWGWVAPMPWAHHPNGQFLVAVVLAVAAGACVISALLWRSDDR